jgi:hypothetical protein
MVQSNAPWGYGIGGRKPCQRSGPQRQWKSSRLAARDPTTRSPWDRRLPIRNGRAVRHSPPARKPMLKPLGEALYEISAARWRQSERVKAGDGSAAVFSPGPGSFWHRWKAGQCPNVEISVRDGADETRARCRTRMSLVGTNRTTRADLTMSVDWGQTGSSTRGIQADAFAPTALGWLKTPAAHIAVLFPFCRCRRRRL